MEEELLNRLALHFLPGIGPVSAKALLSYCGSIENIFRQKKSTLEKIPGIGRERAASINKKIVFGKAEKEIVFIRKHNIKPLFYLDKEYPSRLKNCYDAPLMLFYKGNADLNFSRMIAIVGTRFMTAYGRDMTEKIIEELAKYKVIIVSGLAYGVDIQAHRCALKNNIPTIGVVAHSLDRIYPAENETTAAKMIMDGGIITEYGSGTKADRENFPARNRIVAGMCDATIVIESAEKGGALITADLANDYNRDVFALPGRATDHYSRGCHELIRRNKAMLFESAEQIAEMLNWDDGDQNSKKKNANQLELFSTLNDEERKVVEILRVKGQTGIDSLSIQVAMPVSKVSALLLNLEFAGALRSLPGKIYELV